MGIKNPIEYDLHPRNVSPGMRWLTLRLKNVGEENLIGLDAKLNSLDAYDVYVYGTGSYVAVLILYKLLWSLGNGNTPGASWRGLRLLDLDGRPATREQRMSRLSSEVLSNAALGLGVIWALADREQLTWHDHISRTFLSPKA